MTTRLLHTKLHPPALRPQLVSRHRLSESLGQSMGQPRLSLVAAPAGFGKTTAVRSWLQESKRSFAWLSLEEAENDPGRFFAYLIAALQHLEPDVGQAAHSLLTVPQALDPHVLVTLLTEDLSRLSRPLVLVLDDYHVIRNRALHQALAFLLAHLPPLVQLVIITREDPPLPLSSLRVRGELSELRASDLRFTPEEAAAFFSSVVALPPESVRALVTRTEGWVAGLQLAAMSLKTLPPEAQSAFISAFSGSYRYVVDYLLEQVLSQQAEETRAFLCQSAILDRFCAPLCDVMMGRSDSKRILGQLEQANLFLVPLDDRRDWYRYHHLFAEALRTELSEEEEARLRLKAASWLEAHGQLFEAVEQVLAAKATNEAAKLISRHASALFQRGEVSTLLAWLERLPPEAVQTHTELATYHAWALFCTGQSQAAAASLARLERELPPQASAEGRGRLLALRAWLANRQNQASTADLASEALSLLGEGDTFFRIACALTLGMTQVLQDPRAAKATFSDALALAQPLKLPFLALGAAHQLCICQDILGELRLAEARCREVLQAHVDAQGQPLPIAGILELALGVLLYEKDALEDAELHLLRGRALCQQVGLHPVIMGASDWALVRLKELLGQAGEAHRILYETRAVGERLNQPRMVAAMQALEADLQLKRGDLAFAARWAKDSPFALTGPLHLARDLGAFIHVRLQLAQQRPAEAKRLLDALEAAQAGQNGRMITTHILQALSETRLGATSKGLKHLAQAVRLGAPEGYRRAFLDEGQEVAELLPLVRHEAPDFVDDLLGRFGRRKAEAPAPALPFLAEPLHARELEVLQLIAHGLSTKAVAQRLELEPSTVKWHLSNIYGKLGVSSRTQALVSARALNLL